MGATARASVAGRTWEALGDQILGHYRAVIRAADRAGDRLVRIVQAANFVAPHSGGIKTVLEALGRLHRAATSAPW